jgi:uncharacterized protein (TIGR03437 family)
MQRKPRMPLGRSVILGLAVPILLAAQTVGLPRFTSSGVVNAASLTDGMSPGAFITIFGENLAPRTRSWNDGIQGTSLPTQLDGVSVVVGGRLTYLAYTSPTQLNVLLPTDAVTGPADVTVTTPQGRWSATGTMQRYAPGLFLLTRTGVAATHADSVLVGRASNISGVAVRPALPGEEVALWGTGFGPTAEQLPPGQVPAKVYPLASLADLRVTIGGREARVTFAGVTGPGLYQINVVTPADLGDGDHAVFAEIGGKKTQNNALLAVERPSAPSKLMVSYRLDPWLISGNYGGGFWVSPPVFGPVTQGGNSFTLEVRALGVDFRGQSLDISPVWMPEDPEMITVSPSQGAEIKLTVHRAGQSMLQISSQGLSKVLALKAVYQANALMVQIEQKE